jgi:predicted alpha/beta-fold hydrolase
MAWNFRGCSGVPNRLLRSYHSAATEDLEAVILHALQGGRYDALALIGFSLGGNLTLKYLGDIGEAVDPRIRASVNFSAPVDIAASSMKLQTPSNAIYLRRFLNRLATKVRQKIALFPGQIHDAGLDRMRTFQEFDDAYTAPLHGFKNALDYWARASSRPGIPRIRIPTLLVNAGNDPFLTPECFPYEEARASQTFYLEAPTGGGHLGFVTFDPSGRYWPEKRACEFLSMVMGSDPNTKTSE